MVVQSPSQSPQEPQHLDSNQKYGTKPSGSCSLVSLWRRWSFLDRALCVVASLLVLAEIFFELRGQREKAAAGGDSEGSTAGSAESSAGAGFSATFAGAVALGAVLAALCVWSLRARRNAGVSSPTGFQLRDRNAAKKTCNPCAFLVSSWRRASRFDRILGCFVVFFIVADGIITLKEKGLPDVKSKLPNLRGRIIPTAAPTASPTATPPPPPEDPKAVASAIAAAASNKHSHSSCSDEQIKQVQKSGMSGDKCQGQAFTQQCSFSVLTRGHKATWLGQFAQEVVEARAAENTTHSFLGVMVTLNGDDCVQIDNHLRHMFEGPPDEVTLKIMKTPKLFCTSKPFNSKEFEGKWGLSGSGALIDDTGMTLDQYMIDSGEEKEIKDVVHMNTASEDFKAINGGWVTLARTRYLEFTYDWQGAWGGGSLRAVTTRLDELGHACYWSGVGKLWRITGCWQSFYDFKSYSFVACVNRNLAPKLAEEMEKTFLKTIEAEA